MQRCGIPPASVLGIDLRQEYGIIVDRTDCDPRTVQQGKEGRYLTVSDLERYERDEIAELEEIATADREFRLRWITTRGRLLYE